MSCVLTQPWRSWCQMRKACGIQSMPVTVAKPATTGSYCQSSQHFPSGWRAISTGMRMLIPLHPVGLKLVSSPLGIFQRELINTLLVFGCKNYPAVVLNPSSVVSDLGVTVHHVWHRCHWHFRLPLTASILLLEEGEGVVKLILWSSVALN